MFTVGLLLLWVVVCSAASRYIYIYIYLIQRWSSGRSYEPPGIIITISVYKWWTSRDEIETSKYNIKVSVVIYEFAACIDISTKWIYFSKLSVFISSRLCMLQDYALNPKALSLGELYGEFNLSTNEWLDGVLSSIMRHTCAGFNYRHKYALVICSQCGALA